MVALRCLHTLSFHSLSVTGDGKFKSVSDLAREIGLDVSFAARLLRLTLLAPDIIESILMGEEPSGLSLTMLTKQLPVVWEKQLGCSTVSFIGSDSAQVGQRSHSREWWH